MRRLATAALIALLGLLLGEGVLRLAALPANLARYAPDLLIVATGGNDVVNQSGLDAAPAQLVPTGRSASPRGSRSRRRSLRARRPRAFAGLARRV